MRIAILGTRGIPNTYGGFERFAEVVSGYFAESENEVFVLSPSSQKLENLNYKSGVQIVYIQIPHWLPQNLQTLFYDLKSLIWAFKNNINGVLECGYSYAIWLFLFPKSFRSKIITNPDGIEFNRKKWSFIAKIFLKLCEIFSVKLTNHIVCDNSALVPHFQSRYKITPPVIPYGAYPLKEDPNRLLISDFGIDDNYFLVISRFTPENNIETILNCFSTDGKELVVIGDYSNDFGKSCYAKYKSDSNIKFLGGIYNQKLLDAFRFYARAYIHGHSVGGTNPSLLEAMACKCFVIAHNNSYNRSVLNSEGLYFSDLDDLISVLKHFPDIDKSSVELVQRNNHNRVQKEFSWYSSAQKYLDIFKKI